MIGNKTKGDDLHGLAAYAGRNGENHTAARLECGTLAGRTPEELAAEVRDLIHARRDLAEPVLHWSISLAPGERLTPEDLAAVAEEYTAGMGYESCPWAAWAHEPRPTPAADPRPEDPAAPKSGSDGHPADDGPCQHIHVAIIPIDPTRTDRRGRPARVGDSWDYAKASKILQKCEKEFGLRQAAMTPKEASQMDKRPVPTRQVQKAVKTGDIPQKIILQETIDCAVSHSASIADLSDRLALDGINVKLYKKKGIVSGISFKMDRYAAKGSHLGKGYTANGLNKRIEEATEKKYGQTQPDKRDANDSASRITGASGQNYGHISGDRYDARGHVGRKSDVHERSTSISGITKPSSASENRDNRTHDIVSRENGSAWEVDSGGPRPDFSTVQSSSGRTQKEEPRKAEAKKRRAEDQERRNKETQEREQAAEKRRHRENREIADKQYAAFGRSNIAGVCNIGSLLATRADDVEKLKAEETAKIEGRGYVHGLGEEIEYEIEDSPQQEPTTLASQSEDDSPDLDELLAQDRAEPRAETEPEPEEMTEKNKCKVAVEQIRSTNAKLGPKKAAAWAKTQEILRKASPEQLEKFCEKHISNRQVAQDQDEDARGPLLR